MVQFKRAQVIMLPTDESNLSLNRSYKDYGIGTKVSKPYLTYSKSFKYNKSVTDNSESPQHLYIISDDEIKEGDWCLSKLNELVVFKGKNFNYKKIIATTDISLQIAVKGFQMTRMFFLPQPSQEFIEKYIKSYNKGEIITDIMVEYNESHDSLDFGGVYIPSSLKINPKDNTINIELSEKRTYTEEEVLEQLNLLYSMKNSLVDTFTDKNDRITKKWFEQF